MFSVYKLFFYDLHVFVAVSRIVSYWDVGALMRG